MLYIKLAKSYNYVSNAQKRTSLWNNNPRNKNNWMKKKMKFSHSPKNFIFYYQQTGISLPHLNSNI